MIGMVSTRTIHMSILLRVEEIVFYTYIPACKIENSYTQRLLTCISRLSIAIYIILGICHICSLTSGCKQLPTSRSTRVSLSSLRRALTSPTTSDGGVGSCSEMEIPIDAGGFGLRTGVLGFLNPERGVECVPGEATTCSRSKSLS
ncbi:hypothetical protein KC19_VG241800 [Ceratodon purpureus]|uniref:Uncharacterized protein n=1 Tax=Ceratodon purpureus TaxID=3225 RepID=A0A8T0HTL2_CERPU|nr:hypothetical protein KC19_VG241800 [Ceratodon purpureus]